MKYLTELVFAAVVCGVFAKIAPVGKSKVNKYIKYIVTIAFLCILLSPIIGDSELITDMFSDISSVGEIGKESETDSNDTYYGNFEIISSEICKAAAESAAEHFGVSSDGFYIKLIIDKDYSDEYSIREVTVYPCGEASKIDSETIKSYFEDIFNSSSEVEIYVERT